MTNMDYCKYRNTVRDLHDCYDSIDSEPEDEEEAEARKRLIKLCKKIADGYSEEEVE